MEKEELKSIIEEIKNKTSISEIISNYIKINKAGKNYSALCPFHAEDSPSFYIFPESNTYHCFGCGAHGDLISFVQNYEHVDFIEALKKVSIYAGIPLELNSKVKPPEIIFNENINKIYMDTLLNISAKSKVWDFLKRRGIDENIVREYEIGFSEGKEISEYLKSQKTNENIPFKMGMINKKKEFFSNRIIIPIRNNNGDLAGFSGRTIDNQLGPKYINTPENNYFKKSKLLYLFYKNEKYIKQNDFAIVVEGYFDAISMSNSGFQNTVAVLGTALTEEHSKYLKNATSNIITMFDMDDAGQQATIKTIDNLFKKGFKIAVSLYPAKDPDELVKKKDKVFIAELLKKSYKFHEYIIDVKMKNYDLTNDFAVEKYLEEMAYWYKSFLMNSRYEIAEGFIEKLSETLEKDYSIIKKMLEHKKVKLNKDVYIKENKVITPQNLIKKHNLCQDFIYLWLKYPDYREEIKKFDVNFFEEENIIEFLNIIKETDNISEVLEKTGTQISDMISKAWKMDYKFSAERIFSSLNETYDILLIKKEIQELKQLMKEEKDEKKRSKLISEIFHLYSKLKKHGGK